MSTMPGAAADSDRSQRAVIHSSVLWGLLVVPGFLYLWYRHRAPDLQRESAAAFNGQLGAFGLYFAVGVAAGPLVAIRLGQPLIGWTLYLAVAAWYLYFAVSVTVRAVRGMAPRYPVSIPLIGRGANS